MFITPKMQTHILASSNE